MQNSRKMGIDTHNLPSSQTAQCLNDSRDFQPRYLYNSKHGQRISFVMNILSFSLVALTLQEILLISCVRFHFLLYFEESPNLRQLYEEIYQAKYWEEFVLFRRVWRIIHYPPSRCRSNVYSFKHSTLCGSNHFCIWRNNLWGVLPSRRHWRM